MAAAIELSREDALKRKNRFVVKHEEKLKMNQYWYSPYTIEIMVGEIEEV
jgi:hypothetical protein